ncbi:MAG: SDR family NAD(P)-dependent oxidoreductase [Myxococcales bacterium]|nr:MAG: SDR family NAD(P)-dependent oxidoreductase [Myxococcales bacterium]
MAKTIIVAGYGSGISHAVAEKFGAAGFSLALVARSADKLAAGVKQLEAKGISAAAFPADLGDPSAIQSLVAQVRKQLPPITALHWNAYSSAAGDLLSADANELKQAYDIALTGLVIAVQAALPDLKAQQGAVLVTNGGLGANDPAANDAAVGWNAMGLALTNAAKHKLVGILARRLQKEAVYVGQVTVTTIVKGTSWDDGTATLEASSVAAKFWDLYEGRKDTYVSV